MIEIINGKPILIFYIQSTAIGRYYGYILNRVSKVKYLFTFDILVPDVNERKVIEIKNPPISFFNVDDGNNLLLYIGLNLQSFKIGYYSIVTDFKYVPNKLILDTYEFSNYSLPLDPIINDNLIYGKVPNFISFDITEKDMKANIERLIPPIVMHTPEVEEIDIRSNKPFKCKSKLKRRKERGW